MTGYGKDDDSGRQGRKRQRCGERVPVTDIDPLSSSDHELIDRKKNGENNDRQGTDFSRSSDRSLARSDGDDDICGSTCGDGVDGSASGMRRGGDVAAIGGQPCDEIPHTHKRRNDESSVTLSPSKVGTSTSRCSGREDAIFKRDEEETWALTTCPKCTLISPSQSLESDTSGHDERFPVYLDCPFVVDKHPQTRVSQGWIWVSDNDYASRHARLAPADNPSDVTGLQREWKKLHGSSGLMSSHDSILHLAKRYNVLSGKWLIHISPDNVHVTWPRVRDGVLEGKLGPTAKIANSFHCPSSAGHSTLVVICVYVPDFTDRAEVLRVRRSLRELGVVFVNAESPLYFKPCCFTHLGLYSNEDGRSNSSGDNDKKFQTTIYSCGGKDDMECTTLVSTEGECTGGAETSCPRCYPRCLQRLST